MICTRNIKKVVSVSALLLMTSLTLPATANDDVVTGQHQFGMHKNAMGKSAMKKMRKHLDLSDEQVSSIKLIRSESKQVIEPIKAKVKVFFESTKQLKENKTFDEGAFTSLYTQYQDAFSQLALQKAKTKHAIFQVLTEEQQLKWNEAMMNQKSKRVKKRRFN